MKLKVHLTLLDITVYENRIKQIWTMDTFIFSDEEFI